jgi:hypothetical protein
VAPSVDSGRNRVAIRGLAGAGTALAAVALAGCTTTQHEAQRLQLDAARLRSALAGTRVKTQNARVRPTSIKTVKAGDLVAFVVTVRNAGRRAVTDLPISVGYASSSGSRVYLNSGTDLKYFQAHLPAIRPGKSLTWVYTTTKRIPVGAQLFALVGAKQAVPAKLTETDVRIQLNYGYSPGSHTVTVRLDNPTSVPQYQLQLYAYAPDARGYAAAGNTTVEDLGAGSKQKVKLSLVGAAGVGKLEVRAIPTILQ